MIRVPLSSPCQVTLTRFKAHFAVILSILSLICAATSARLSAQSLSGFTYTGQVYTSYQANEYLQSPQGAQGTAAIRATGASYGSVVATQYVQTYTSNTIAPETANTPGYDSSKDPLSPTDSAVVAAIQNMHAQGITVFMKPQVDSLDGVFRGNFAPTNVADWFASYQTFILHYAQIASDNNVGGLIIGTELISLTKSTYKSYWANIIAQLRSSYPNLTLAYGANATYASDEFTTVSFWDKVDIIGVDGYFPLTNHANPTVAELVAAWTNNKDGLNIVAALKNLQSTYNKPLIFTELGYVSATGTNEAPFASAAAGAPYDPTEQNNCYEAFFEVFSQQTSWMKGVFWWAWNVSPPGPMDTGYTPQNKPAADTTLVKWYGSPNQGFTLAPATSVLTIGDGLAGSDLISVTNLGGFTGSVLLTATGLPSGVTASFAPGTVGGTQLLTVTASSTATAGPALVTITGTSGSLMATTSVEITLQGATAQTITFANPGAQTEGTPLALSATASSGLPVAFVSTTLGVCTVNDATATFVGAGTCSITASQAGNSVYSAAPSISQSFTVSALASVPIPANAEIVVSQVNWLNSQGGNASTSGNPAGGSFATNSIGDVVVANTNNLVLFNATTGASTVLGAWTSASAVAVDSRNNIYVGNLYGPVNVIVKVPYIGGSTNGGYAAFTTPTASTAACTSASTTECALPIAGAVNPGAMAFDANGDLFYTTAGSGSSSGNSIYKCSATCLSGSTAPVQIYQEPTASTAPSTSSGQLLAGGLAIDPSGNIFFTDSSIYVNASYAITSFSSNLNELSASKGTGYGGVTTGYAATPSILYTVTPATVSQYDNQLDGVAIDATTGTVYFADQNDGVFAFPNTGSAIPVANGQPTSLYAVSTQGAKTIAIDNKGNLYFIAYSTVINSSGGDTLGQITLDTVSTPASPVGTAISPSSTLNPVTTILNDSGCSSSPAPSVTFNAGTASNATATVATTGNCSPTLTGGSAFATNVSFTPTAGGADSISLNATDQASNTGTVTVSGAGQIVQGPQTITFATPAAQVLGTPLTLSATASSGLAVTFTSSTPTVCTVSGDIASFLLAGACTIDANQAGNAYYLAAAQVARSFTVAAAPSFSLAPATSALSVAQGGTANDTITVAPANGFTGSTTLVASGLPSGVTATFATNPTSTSSLVTFTVSSTATAGTSTVTITGTSGTLTSSTTIALTVSLPPSFTLTPTSPALSIVQGNSGTDTITVTPANGFTGSTTLAASGLPSGVTATFAINPTSTSSLLTFTVSSTATAGTSTVTITGTSGTLTSSTTIALTVSLPPSFTLTPSAPALSIVQGNSGTDTISVTAANGFNGNATLVASGLPSGVTASFSTNPTSASSLLTFTVSSTAMAGTSTVTITGTSGNLTASTTIALTISLAPSFTIAPASASLAVTQGNTATDTISINGANGFASSVNLTASGLPTGVTASFATNPASGSSVVTFTASSAAPVGVATISVTGTSGSLTAATTITLTVNAAPGVTLATATTGVSNTPGSSTTDTITISGSGGFVGTVALSAAVTSSPAGAQDLPTLSFGSTSPVSVTPAGATAVLTITTTAPTAASLSHPSSPWTLGGSTLACIVLLGMPFKRRRRFLSLGILTVLCALSLGIVGCGGGGQTTTPPANPGTRPGNYTITVTATSGTITTTLPITLTVQ